VAQAQRFECEAAELLAWLVSEPLDTDDRVGIDVRAQQRSSPRR